MCARAGRHIIRGYRVKQGQLSDHMCVCVSQVTLLLCNAVAMEALPIFLDKIMSEVAAIIVSVTAVLFMGEIFPQAICSK